MTHQIAFVHGLGTQVKGWSLDRKVNLEPYVRSDTEWGEITWRVDLQEPISYNDMILLETVAIQEMGLREVTRAPMRLGYSPLDYLLAVREFSGFLLSRKTREACLERFRNQVRPLAEKGNLSLITHSWGTIVAYLGLQGEPYTGVTLYTAGAALSFKYVRQRLKIPEDRRPIQAVSKFINLCALGDTVGGSLKGDFPVDEEFLSLPPDGCPDPEHPQLPCAHESYFVHGSFANQKIFPVFLA